MTIHKTQLMEKWDEIMTVKILERQNIVPLVQHTSNTIAILEIDLNHQDSEGQRREFPICTLLFYINRYFT